MKNGKTRNTIILSLVVIAGIMAIMIIANSKSNLVMQIEHPPDGVKKLFTVNNDLVCVSPGNEIYIWDWDNLSAEPEKTQVAALDVTWMIGKKLVWAPTSDLNKILVTDISGLKAYSEILLNYGWQCKILQTSRNGKFTVIGLIDKTIDKDNKDSYKHIQLGVIDSAFKGIVEAVTFDAESNDFALSNVAISDDGKFVAVAGKNNGGWIAVADVAEKKVLWEKLLDGTTNMLEVTFSPDGNRIYAGGHSQNIYGFDVKTAEIIHSWIIGKSKLEVTQIAINRSITAIEISPDNKRIVAAATDSMAYVWDTDTGLAICNWNPGQRSTVGSITFSKNKRYLATAGIVIKPKINVWDASFLD